MGHTITDNHHGLVASAMVSSADGFAEREATKVMIHDAKQAAKNPDAEITLGADKGYDAQEFIEACTAMSATPHVTQNTSGRRSAVPDAIASSEGMPSRSKRENSLSRAVAGPRRWGVRPLGLRRKLRSRTVFRTPGSPHKKATFICGGFF